MKKAESDVEKKKKRSIRLFINACLCVIVTSLCSDSDCNKEATYLLTSISSNGKGRLIADSRCFTIVAKYRMHSFPRCASIAKHLCRECDTARLCDCIWVSFDPRERTICGLATVADGRGASINVSAQPLNKQQI